MFIKTPPTGKCIVTFACLTHFAPLTNYLLNVCVLEDWLVHDEQEQAESKQVGRHTLNIATVAHTYC